MDTTVAAPPPPGTLAAALARGRDNFLLLRLVAASLVIYGHARVFTGVRGWPDLFTWLGWGTYSGDLAVDVFFVVSGYMIAGSYLRRRHLPDFLWARAIRIYPAYALCILATAFVLGTAYTELPLRAYLHSPGLFHYLGNLWLRPALVWTLPGVFAHNPRVPYVSGSIWTLPAEVRLYLWVAVLGVSGMLTRRGWGSLALVLLFVLGLRAPAHLPLVPLPLPAYLRLAGYFAAGVFCYLQRGCIPVAWPWAFGAAVLAWLLHGSALYPYAFGLAVAMTTFALAYATPWYGYNRCGDYSYGLYLWGFPMQQVVAHHAPRLGPLANALAAWWLAMALAALSWHLVEKPMLRLKDLPSRGHASLRRWLAARGSNRDAAVQDG